MQWTPELVERFWDYHSTRPHEYFTFHSGHVIAARLKRHLKDRDTVLDYGSGPGFFIPHLLALGARVAAVDHSPDSLEKLKNRFEREPRFLGAFLPTEIEGRFDAVIAIEVVEHLEDPELKEMFDHVRDLLAPHGIAIFTTPNAEDLNESTVYCPVSNVTFHRWQHVRSWDAGTLSRALQEHGYEVITTFDTDFSVTPRGPVTFTKMHLKRLLGRRLPHLVGIARRDSS